MREAQVFKGPAVIPDPDRYPILVKRLTGEQALVIACLVCDAEYTITGDEIRNERNYSCRKCLGPADYKYEEADYECPSCGKLHFDRLPYGHGVCSRVCHLQHEYAQHLAQRVAS